MMPPGTPRPVPKPAPSPLAFRARPAELAPFAAESPFAGLAVPAEVKVHQQVLARPDAQLAGHTWARLSDGTPLVTEAVRGAGRIVLFHVTANADWSDLPLSGLFVQMLRRMVDLSVGVSGAEDASGVKLAPVETLDGFGQPGAPPPVAGALTAAELARALPSPRHPPGLYGPESGRRVLNLATHLGVPVAAAEIGGARQERLGAAAPERALAPWLIAAALALLAVDLLVSLRLRGLFRASIAAGMVLMLGMGGAQAALNPDTNPALVTRLAYLVTGDARLDGMELVGHAVDRGELRERVVARLRITRVRARALRHVHDEERGGETAAAHLLEVHLEIPVERVHARRREIERDVDVRVERERLGGGWPSGGGGGRIGSAAARGERRSER